MSDIFNQGFMGIIAALVLAVCVGFALNKLRKWLGKKLRK